MDVTRLENPTELRGKLRQIANTYGWSPCVGAGTSLNIFGDWKELAKSLLQRIECPPEAISQLAASYSSDALIQTVFNALASRRRAFSEKDFVSLLSERLYESFKESCGGEWKVAAKALSTLDPRKLSMAEWKDYLKLVERCDRWTPSFRPLSAENKMDSRGLLS